MVVVPRPDTGKHSGPELDHDTLDARQSERRLRKPVEKTLNLGHPTTVDRLHEHPLSGIVDYTSTDAASDIAKGQPAEVRGVYGRSVDVRSGLATESNIDDWSKRASSNSYHGKDAPDRHTRDPRGRPIR